MYTYFSQFRQCSNLPKIHTLTCKIKSTLDVENKRFALVTQTTSSHVRLYSDWNKNAKLYFYSHLNSASNLTRYVFLQTDIQFRYIGSKN